MIRVIVCGDRDWEDEFPIIAVLGYLFHHCKQTKQKLVLIEGGARGADNVAASWAQRYEHDKALRWVQMEASWDELGPSAGPIRNKAMLKKLLKGPEGATRCVFAFHSDLKSSVGTKHMVRIATKAGIDTYVTGKS